MFSFKRQPIPKPDILSRVLRDIQNRKEDRPNLEERIHAATKDYPGFAALLEALSAVEAVKVLPHDCTLPCIRLRKDPRIRFEAPLEFARALRKEVLADARREQPALCVPWDVMAAREDALGSAFELSCAEYLEESKRYYSHQELYALITLFRPENLAHDFAALTEMVKKAGEQFQTANSKTEE